jgi:hypothetical protein
VDNVEQSGFELDALSEDGFQPPDQDIQPMTKSLLCAAWSRDFYGTHHYGLRGLPVSPYHLYDLLRLFLFKRFIAFSCFSLLRSPLLK